MKIRERPGFFPGRFFQAKKPVAAQARAPVYPCLYSQFAICILQFSIFNLQFAILPDELVVLALINYHAQWQVAPQDSGLTGSSPWGTPLHSHYFRLSPCEPAAKEGREDEFECNNNLRAARPASGTSPQASGLTTHGPAGNRCLEPRHSGLGV